MQHPKIAKVKKRALLLEQEPKMFSCLAVRNRSLYSSAPQPFLTCGTLKKLAKFGGTQQHTKLVNAQKMQKNMDLFLYINEKFNGKPTKPVEICGKLAELFLKSLQEV